MHTVMPPLAWLGSGKSEMRWEEAPELTEEGDGEDEGIGGGIGIAGTGGLPEPRQTCG
jgi:hypothetical protein